MVLEGVNPVTWFYLGIGGTEVGTCVHVHGDKEGGQGQLLMTLTLKVDCRVGHILHRTTKPPKPPSSHEDKLKSPLKEPFGFRGPVRGASSGLL